MQLVRLLHGKQFLQACGARDKFAPGVAAERPVQLSLKKKWSIRQKVEFAPCLLRVCSKALDGVLDSPGIRSLYIAAVDAISAQVVHFGLFFRQLGVGGFSGIDDLTCVAVGGYLRAFALLAYFHWR